MCIDNDPRSGKPRISTDERSAKLVADEKIVVQYVKNILEPRKQKLRRRIPKNLPHLLVAGPLTLHDNARSHIADVVTKKLRDYGWEVLPHAPYSPDMSPPDFDLFPKLIEPMLGRKFSSMGELSTDGIRTIRRMNKSGVLDGIIMLPKRWDLGIEKQGHYIIWL